ncbi:MULTISPECIES: 50S ribosomal protein L13 [Borrelia]|uniref:Large ribosomal subunit protein uL13 n=2 Tax=Borrelia turicatae TaxID=142 RepID=RL13_BORT9|nr:MULTISPECIES: 50S ribosomal protein L13 [Borrelia]A1QZD1.1 RecName: Full=Large ribosomal subunit protein uL13; AltName: Full=50S ribosomal protein L13 [Borrelia turicatae 91E135]AAX17673.1 LSU ribosomal protein L13P [Borrelia turicatae 91E135]ANF33824.1 50S ribosomal protein L13 [Borrelia turicatae]UPA12019.1 50S ribosomal protein L13 [Borrelia venezuelensis]UPA13191.1 50S ribosomal protein L13 [Borrelia turicatae 91E135]UPA14676.1 50S ribosomal protein L13 [Borrelia turicatae]
MNRITNNKTIWVKPKCVEKKWCMIDASDKVLGRVATEAVKILRGKHKPYYTPHQDLGDNVIIINASKIRLTGKKYSQKIYYRHSRYPGGLRSDTFRTLSERKPTAPLEIAIKGMLPKGPLGRELFRNLKVFAGSNHMLNSQNFYKLEAN